MAPPVGTSGIDFPRASPLTGTASELTTARRNPGSSGGTIPSCSTRCSTSARHRTIAPPGYDTQNSWSSVTDRSSSYLPLPYRRRFTKRFPPLPDRPASSWALQSRAGGSRRERKCTITPGNRRAGGLESRGELPETHPLRDARIDSCRSEGEMAHSRPRNPPERRARSMTDREEFNAGARIRTWELLREQILSLPPLAARPPRRRRGEESAGLIRLPFPRLPRRTLR